MGGEVYRSWEESRETVIEIDNVIKKSAFFSSDTSYRCFMYFIGTDDQKQKN